jgi:hypothetical protein
VGRINSCARKSRKLEFRVPRKEFFKPITIRPRYDANMGNFQHPDKFLITADSDTSILPVVLYPKSSLLPTYSNPVFLGTFTYGQMAINTMDKKPLSF